jgi:hypothetical protein
MATSTHDQHDYQGKGVGTAGSEDLPIPDYADLTVDQVTAKLDGLSNDQIEQIKAYEQSHLARETLLAELDRWSRRTAQR